MPVCFHISTCWRALMKADNTAWREQQHWTVLQYNWILMDMLHLWWSLFVVLCKSSLISQGHIYTTIQGTAVWRGRKTINCGSDVPTFIYRVDLRTNSIPYTRSFTQSVWILCYTVVSRNIKNKFRKN